MTIAFQCPQCQANFRVKPDMAGRVAKCKCGARLTVPTPKPVVEDDLFASDLSSFESAGAAVDMPRPEPTNLPPVQSAAGNPYSAPATSGHAAAPSSTGVGCPNCGDSNFTKVHWTWWGGLIGPLIIPTVACASCSTHFNGRTGKYNTTAIVIYFSICAGIGITVAILGAIGSAL